MEDHVASKAIGSLKHECLGVQVHALKGAGNQHHTISLNHAAAEVLIPLPAIDATLAPADLYAGLTLPA